MIQVLKIKNIIITIIVVGLLSLIPYSLLKDTHDEKIVKENDEFKIGIMTYKIPKDFVYVEDDEDNNYKNYHYNEDSIYCYLNLEVYNTEYTNYETGEEYIKKNVLITLDDEIESSTTDDWFTINIKENDKTRKVSAIKKNNEIYFIEYAFGDYNKGENTDTESYEKCSTAYDYIFKSIKFYK